MRPVGMRLQAKAASISTNHASTLSGEGRAVKPSAVAWTCKPNMTKGFPAAIFMSFIESAPSKHRHSLATHSGVCRVSSCRSAPKKSSTNLRAGMSNSCLSRDRRPRTPGRAAPAPKACAISYSERQLLRIRIYRRYCLQAPRGLRALNKQGPRLQTKTPGSTRTSSTNTQAKSSSSSPAWNTTRLLGTCAGLHAHTDDE